MGGDWKEKIRRILPQLVRFGCVACVALGFKLLVVWALEPLLNPYLAYFITHVAIFVVSYLMHSKLTFRAELSWRRSWDYLKAVIWIKAFDYLAFSVVLTAFEIDSLVAVFAVTLFVGIVRFLFARRALLS